MVALGVIALIIIWAGAFGIAWGVYEWRGGGGNSNSMCELAQKTYWQGLITPNVSQQTMDDILNYLRKHC